MPLGLSSTRSLGLTATSRERPLEAEAVQEELSSANGSQTLP